MNVNIEELRVQKNESGFTVFMGPIIYTDAPYDRLKRYPKHKSSFLRVMRETEEELTDNSKKVMGQWIKEIEELKDEDFDINQE